MPSICPRQDHPPLLDNDGNAAPLLFDRATWLYLHSLGVGGSGGGGGSALVQEILLEADTTINQTPTFFGALFKLVVVQDSTGGWKITLNPSQFSFMAIALANINADPNKTTIFSLFLRQDGLWWPDAYPVIEES